MISANWDDFRKTGVISARDGMISAKAGMISAKAGMISTKSGMISANWDEFSKADINWQWARNSKRQ